VSSIIGTSIIFNLEFFLVCDERNNPQENIDNTIVDCALLYKVNRDINLYQKKFKRLYH
jgi:hypothetical protein